MKKELKTSALRVHEWLAIVVITSTLFGVGLINHIQNNRYAEKQIATNKTHRNTKQPQSKRPPPPTADTITVSVRGAVKNEQRLIVPKGTLLQDLTDRLIFDDDA